jgi:hypothetical protein
MSPSNLQNAKLSTVKLPNPQIVDVIKRRHDKMLPVLQNIDFNRALLGPNSLV